MQDPESALTDPQALLQQWTSLRGRLRSTDLLDCLRTLLSTCTVSMSPLNDSDQKGGLADCHSATAPSGPPLLTSGQLRGSRWPDLRRKSPARASNPQSHRTSRDALRKSAHQLNYRSHDSAEELPNGTVYPDRSGLGPPCRLQQCDPPRGPLPPVPAVPGGPACGATPLLARLPALAPQPHQSDRTSSHTLRKSAHQPYDRLATRPKNRRTDSTGRRPRNRPRLLTNTKHTIANSVPDSDRGYWIHRPFTESWARHLNSTGRNLRVKHQ